MNDERLTQLRLATLTTDDNETVTKELEFGESLGTHLRIKFRRKKNPKQAGAFALSKKKIIFLAVSRRQMPEKKARAFSAVEKEFPSKQTNCRRLPASIFLPTFDRKEKYCIHLVIFFFHLQVFESILLQ